MTLREHLEAIRDERNAVRQGDPFEAYVVSMGIVSLHAAEALAILDAAERERNDSRDPSNRYPLDRVLIDDPSVSS